MSLAFKVTATNLPLGVACESTVFRAALYAEALQRRFGGIGLALDFEVRSRVLGDPVAYDVGGARGHVDVPRVCAFGDPAWHG